MDIRQIITDKIIALLERGTSSSGPRWTGGQAEGLPINAKTIEAYRGTIEAHADYVQSRLRGLKNDKSAIFTAASQAAKAADHILACRLAQDTTNHGTK